MNWNTVTVSYVPLKESEIVAPSNMFIVADRAGWIGFPEGEGVKRARVDVFVGEASVSPKS